MKINLGDYQIFNEGSIKHQEKIYAQTVLEYFKGKHKFLYCLNYSKRKTFLHFDTLISVQG